MWSVVRWGPMRSLVSPLTRSKGIIIKGNICIELNKMYLSTLAKQLLFLFYCIYIYISYK